MRVKSRASQTMAIRSWVVVMGRSARRSTMSAGDLRGVGLRRRVRGGPSASSRSDMRLTSAEAGWPRVGSIRMSSGPGLAVGEAAGRVVDLRAGDAEVGEDAVDLFDAGLGEDGRQGGEVVVERGRTCAVGRRLRGGRGAASMLAGSKSMPIRRPPGAEAVEECGGVAAEAERAVDDDLAGAGVEGVEHLVEEDGDVAGGHGYFKSTVGLSGGCGEQVAWLARLSGEVALDEVFDGPDQVLPLLAGGAEDAHAPPRRPPRWCRPGGRR